MSLTDIVLYGAADFLYDDGGDVLEDTESNNILT